MEAETLTPTFDPGSCELDGTHIVVKNSLFSLGVSELWKTFQIRLIRAGEYCAAIRFKLHDLFLKIPKAFFQAQESLEKLICLDAKQKMYFIK